MRPTKIQISADKPIEWFIVSQRSEPMKTTKKHSSTRGLTKKQPQPKPKPRASNTFDILGGPDSAGQQSKVNRKWVRHLHHLLELRDQLLIQSGKLAKEATEGLPSFSLHPADAGTDSFDRDFALSMLSSDQDALYEIEQAIKRIENGTFGVCELTGKPIPKGRLEAIPWARFSAPAQHQLEREGALKHRQLSALSSMPPAEMSEGEESDEGSTEPGDKE
jgi:DnaK suppressor protein